MSLLWLKTLHIVSAVAWFAGLFYIFRLYVYHVENHDKAEVVAVLQTMERKLYRYIMTPAMLSTLAFGLAMFHRGMSAYLATGWFQVKLVALAALFAYHFYSGHVRKQLAAGECTLSSKQCRLINEAPTVLLIVIVAMAVVKPW